MTVDQKDQPAEPKAPQRLSPRDVEDICAIVTTAPCPAGIPQAKLRAALLDRFIASQAF